MKSYLWKDEQSVDVISNLFLNKKVIVGSTDTIPGLMAPVTEWAFDKLQSIKIRTDKPFVVLMSRYEQAIKMIDSTHWDILIQVIKNIWPAPVTCIFPMNQFYAPWLFKNQKTIGIRMPNHPDLLKIIEKCGPLFSTSINKSGQLPALSLAEIDPSIQSVIEASFVDFSNQGKECKASTIIDITSSKPILVREGAFLFNDFVNRLYCN